MNFFSDPDNDIPVSPPTNCEGCGRVLTAYQQACRSRDCGRAACKAKIDKAWKKTLRMVKAAGRAWAKMNEKTILEMMKK